MISKISLENFKCFRNLNVAMSNLNVLAGINSSGKSSFIQALLMVHLIAERPYYSDDWSIPLNNVFFKIGTNKDLFFNKSENDIMSITLTTDLEGLDATKNIINNAKFEFKFNGDSDIASYSENWGGYESNEIQLYSLCDDFCYISADRMTPQQFYRNSSSNAYEYNIGVNGQHTVHFLATKGGETLVENKALIRKTKIENNDKIKTQAQSWLSIISPGTKIDTEIHGNMGISRIGFYTEENKIQHSPNNVGYGLSYALPVIVALLKAPIGGIVVLENPEAHIHPKGQRHIGEMIALAAAGGVQVIVETHSDHILNGIRLAVRNKKIDKEKIKINYFSIDEDGEHIKQTPEIQEDGSLSDWPDGFFDEWDKAIMDLL